MKGLIVQLQRRAKIASRTLWRLYPHDVVAVRESRRRVDIAGRIHVNGRSTFSIEDLLQPLLCPGLWRRFLPNSQRQAWPSNSEYDKETDNDHGHRLLYCRSETDQDIDDRGSLEWIG